MRLQGMLSACFKFLFTLTLLFPFAAYAHLLSITAASPFPGSITIGNGASATYTVRNTTTTTTLEVVNQTQFPAGSGLSITANTCGVLAPQATCTVSVSLATTNTPKSVNGLLKLWAKPSADGVSMPISISVNPIYITPIAPQYGRLTPSTVQSLSIGQNATFRATPDAGFGIDQWIVDGAPVASQADINTYTLFNNTADHTITATFVKSWVLTTSVETTGGATGAIGGSISPNPNTPQTVPDGSNYTFTATPVAPFITYQWYDNGVLVQSGGATYNLTNITADHAVKVVFIAYNVTSSVVGGNGSIAPLGTTTVTSGANLAFTASPALNYGVNQWLLDDIVVQSGGTSYNLVGITANHTVKVTFQPYPVVTAAILQQPPTETWTVSPPTSIIAPGSNITLTASAVSNIPNSPYQVAQWFRDGTPQLSCNGLISCTFTNITANTAITTSLIAYTITPSFLGNGAIIPSVPVIVTPGGTYEFTASPAAGQSVVKWVLDGTAIPSCAANITCTVPVPPIAANHLLTLVMTPFTLSTPAAITTSAGPHGSISAPKSRGTKKDSALIFTAKPDRGYVVDEWQLDKALSQTGGNTYSAQLLTGKHSLHVTFKKPESVAMASGVDISGSRALVAVRTSDANGWSVINTPTVFGAGHFASGSCTKGGNTVSTNSVCVAVGDSSLTAKCTNDCTPLLGVSTDGGSTWSVKSTAGAPAYATYTSSSCTGTGLSAVCVIAGRDLTETQPPFLAMSKDGGNNWAATPVAGALPVSGIYHAASCTGTSTNAVCMAAGQNLTNNAPLLASSNNGGSNWSVKTIQGASSTAGTLNGASCTSSSTGTATVCVAAGHHTDATLNDSLLVVSTDGGNSWNTKTITNAPAKAELYSASCTGHGVSARCVAVGQNLSNGSPFIALSQNGAANWTTVNAVTGAPVNGTFSAASCTGQGTTAICLAAGQNLINSAPLLVISKDGGATWSTVTTVEGGLPAKGAFFKTECSGNGKTAFCSAAGQDTSSTQTPLIVTSKDGGNTWTKHAIAGAPEQGKFYDAPATRIAE